MGIKYIDAKRLRRVLIGGGRWIQKHENYLNELNVYPVPDGDTGTNMSMTVQTMIEKITDETNEKTNMKDLVSVVEDAVLIGARGNSGTILSQIITGFLRSIEEKKKLKAKDIAEALVSAKELAYKVVDTPVEGTMLTTIRMVSERAVLEQEMEDLTHFIEALVEEADKSVEITPELLPKLKEAGVVDSGAKGLFYFFVGAFKILSEIELLTKSSVIESEFDKTILNIDHNIGDIKHKYCTEFIILNSDFDKEEFKKELLELGDSAVFASSSKKFKVHIHSNTPGLVIEKASSIADLQNIKIENMKLQNDGVIQNEKDIAKIFVNKNKVLRKDAYIILADTIALKDEFLKMGADVVILGGQGQNPSVNDILNAVEKVEENRNIYVLPNNKNVIAAANLAVEKTSKPLIILPTKTMMEGMFYLMYPFMSINTKTKLSKLNYSVEITRAVRETTVDSMKIEVDDYLVLVNTKIKFVAKTIEEAIDSVLDNLVTNNTLTLTVVEGIEKHENIIEKIKKLDDKFTVPTKIIDAKQENYEYYILIENKDEKLPDIAILTDSSSDISLKEKDEHEIHVIPIRLESDGEQYKDGENLTKEEFWSMLINDKKTFKSSQPAPKTVMNMYNDIFRRGYKKILVLPISSKLSGTYQVLKLAREMIKKENDIKVYDSKSVSFKLSYMAIEAAKKAKARASMEQIVHHLDKFSEKSKLYIVVESLEYLQRGGRISKTAQTIGDFFNMKPILTLSNGSLTVEKKVLGGEASVMKYIEKSIYDYTRESSVYVEAAAGGTQSQVEQSYKILEHIKQNRKVSVISEIKEIGATVGTHSGPVYGILIVPKLL